MDLVRSLIPLTLERQGCGELTLNSKYAWFCAARNTAWLFGVAQSNRLLDVNGKMTAL